MSIFSKKEKQKSADYYIALLHGNWDVLNPNRYSIFDGIIKEALPLEGSLYRLACALAFYYSGAKYRNLAIQQFEQYLLDPVPTSEASYYEIYGTLGKAYEGEYIFDKAEEFYKKEDLEYRQLQKQKYDHCRALGIDATAFEPTPNIKLGRLYLKLGTQKAINYWESVKKDPWYLKEGEFKRLVDFELADTQEKHKRGYVYKPRKRLE